MNTQYAFGLIDAERGFMPAAEGERLGVPGFGELPIPNGERIVPKVNRLLAHFATKQYTNFVTRDWHPKTTAHFSAEPNFTTTWPKHCVANTPGAELHPDLAVPEGTYWFVKGTDALKDGKDDMSYSGYNAHQDEDSYDVPELLNARGVTTLVLGGLALDYCVGKTALDFRQKMGLEVIVAVDATRPVTEETGKAMLAEFAENGIRTMTTNQIIKLTA